MPAVIPAALVLLVPASLVFRAQGELVRPVTVTLGAALLAGALLRPRWRVPALLAEVLAGASLALGVLLTSAYLGGYLHLGPAESVGLAVLNAVAAVVAVTRGGAGRARWWWLPVAVAAVAEQGWAIHEFHPLVDVAVWTHDGWWALVHGRSPYGITIPDIFDARGSALNYAPAVLGHGRVLEGYPYLPGSLLVDGPGVLLGDDRVVSLLLVVAIAGLAWSLADDRLGRLCAAMVLLGPLTVPVVLHHWTEPVLGLGMALLAWGMARERRRVGLVGVAVALTSKQYAVVFLPLGRLVVRRCGGRALAVTVALLAGLLLGFLLWDPSGFLRSTVWFHSHQLVRVQSVSLTDALALRGVSLPGWMTGWGSVAAGVAVAGLLQGRVRGPGTWCLVAALAWTASVLFSRQGQTNYYWLVCTLLLLGCVLHRDAAVGVVRSDRAAGAPTTPRSPDPCGRAAPRG